MSPFIHLHTHSDYSLLDGMSKIGEMVKLATEYEMPALALTDHGVLYGAIDFYKACTKAGIKPIIGMEAYVAPHTIHDRRPGIDNHHRHLTLLATNHAGYVNLVKLVTTSHLEGFFGKPRVDKNLLRAHAEGLICLSGDVSSELAYALNNDDTERAENIVKEHQDIFGIDNYFIEVTHHPLVEGAPKIREASIALAKKLNVPLVATQDSHYLRRDDQRAHETLLAVQQSSDPDDVRRLFLSGDDFSFIDTPTAYEYFQDIPEAVENTQKIADRCNLELTLGVWSFPNLEIPEGTTYGEVLKKACYEGLSFREMKKTPEVEERIAYELDIIETKGYSGYILIVADLMRFARENQILTTARGSGAGSLVCYLTGITNVDPLYFNLPFERFLNPERPSAPDIDMDFADARREEVIEYARKKYGEDHVAQIGTFGTMMARGAVRDVARAAGYPYAVGDRISKMIPMGKQGFPMTVDRALEMIPELDDIYKKEEDAQEIIDLAKRLEGTSRHVSIHAAGVVIAPHPLRELIPTQFDPTGEKIITQYDMHCVEDMGLVKFDFLGIKNLSILSDAIDNVEKHHGIRVDIEKIPMDDATTYALLARGETNALFQLNGAGMTRYVKELKPDNIHDINAMVALYRPGPMAFIPDYIARKENPELVTYMDPRMEPILKNSYGIITYQDDILMIAIQLAGYSWGEADKFRKAIGKKIPTEMQLQKDKFIKGCLNGGMTRKTVRELWEQIETFAAYGFNKSHAASYGRVAYQTAYMKANYPAEYMAAVMTSDAGDVEKIAEFIAECRRMSLSILPPDINESIGVFSVVKGDNETPDGIRVGLYSIKNFGTEIADAIIAERERGGRFASFADILERVTHRNLNKKSLESLIMCGALDSLGERGQMLANMDSALAYSREQIKNADTQGSLFGLMTNQETVPQFKLAPANPAPPLQKLRWEKELLGIYTSGHPLDPHRSRITLMKLSLDRIATKKEGVMTKVAGVVDEAKTILTKKGEKMAFVTLSDFTTTLEVVVFPSTYERYKTLLENDDPLMITGKVSKRNDETSLLVETMKRL